MPEIQGEPTLAGKMLEPLPLGQIRPRGWLLDQLRIQANGLSGHLDEFWPDVAESGWIGGKAEGWERGPYWLDGVVPLAFLLDDAALKGKVQHWVDYILEHQHADGWLGPVHDAHYGYEYDPWPVYVALKALTQYYEATQDRRAIAAMQRFLRRLDELLDQQPLQSWGHFRWADSAVSIYWLYEHTHEPWLLDLAAKVHDQGFDWRSHFENFPYREKTRPEECNLI
ncbi:MAG TPA: beta-L-arabinofuranosidase domain-containing protein, partial [Herpetosiphonaceae bacterium]|nr:beta-L-arabinofuranosidase domain-containing protein [Herpetosiphonaceae bacterium]